MAFSKYDQGDYGAELQTLTQAIVSGKEKKIDLILFMQDCISLFEKFDNCIQSGNLREKEVFYRKIKELGQKVDEEIVILTQESGKDEEEISAYVENPDNYSSEVWASIQKAHRRIIKPRKRKH